MAKKITLTNAECKRRALLAADWFVNTQVVQRGPQWDANHGRIIYNYHLPTRQRVLGLSWSQGRAIMCLLGAWELAEQQKYFDAAVRCGDYLRYALQSLDQRHRRSFGAFREEVPASRFSFPRDGIEGAFGLLMLHMATGEADYLERCELFADWYLKFAYTPDDRWVRGRVGFDNDEDPYRLSYIQGGGAPFFWHLHQITRSRRYLQAVRMLADGMIERFIDPETGAILADSVGTHHSVAIGGRPVVFNDDGSSIALTCAHAAFESPTSLDASGRPVAAAPGKGRPPEVPKYLAAALRYGDWIINGCPRPVDRFVANGMQSILLTELTALTGQFKYADFARRLVAEQVKLQFIAPGKPDRHGGFRGEDENPDWYVKGARARDFIVTRTTAYATLAMLRLHDRVHGPSYSALGLTRLMKARTSPTQAR